MAHVVLGADLGAALELLVEAAERRALVAGDERAGLQAARAVGAVLVEQHAHEGLDAGEEDPALLEQVLVVEGDLAARALAAAAHCGAAAALRALAAAAVRSFAKCVWGSSLSPRSIGSAARPLANETYH